MYRLTPSGTLTLVTTELGYPNGIALSPDEKTLYVANADAEKPVVMAYALPPGGAAIPGRVFFDATPLVRAGRKGVPDGMKVDQRGNVFLTGPGGVLVLSPTGRHLGTIVTGRRTSPSA